MNINLRFFLTWFFILASWSVIYSQSFSGEFGKNRMQFSNFQWQFYSTENYEIYYYRGGQKLAQNALEILEKEYPRITNIIGYAPYIKTKILIYTSLKDLQESNVGVDGKNFNENGQTDLIKLLVEVPYSGVSSEFEETLVYHLSKTLLTDMMYGGNLIARFQSAYLLTLPPWFIDGMARYLAYGWSIDMDDFTRDLLYNKKVKYLDHFEGDDASMIGQSVWNYIGSKYGKTNISNILNLTRIIHDEEKSIGNSLSLPYKQFVYDWNTYYLDATAKIESGYKTVSSEKELVSKTKKVTYPALSFNPDSSILAYAKINDGRFRIISKNLETGKEKQVYSGGVRFHDRIIASEIPTMEWIDKSTLGITFNQYGQLYLGILNIETGKKIKKALPRLNQIKSIDFNYNGRLAVVSAEVKGQNDLYLLSMYKNAIKRLTKDDFDDLHPKFIPGTNKIVFSSNRKTGDEIESEFIKNEDIFNLFIYDLDKRTEKITTITKTISSDIKPLAVNEDRVYFLNNSKGIYNLYRVDIESGLNTQVTDYNNSILGYSMTEDERQIAFSTRNKRREKIYLTELDPSQTAFTPPTLRTELQQALFVKEKIKKAKQKEKAIQDSIKLANPIPKAAINTSVDSTASNLDDKFIDTKGFVFETEVEPEETAVQPEEIAKAKKKKAENKPTSFLSNYTRAQKEEDVTGPNPYVPQFSVDNITTTVFVDPVIGFGFRFETRINELLENHKFYGRLETKASLRSGSYAVGYRYTKYLVDFQLKHERKAYNLGISPFLDQRFSLTQSDILRQKYTLNSIIPGLSLPLSSTARVEANVGIINSRFVNQNASSGRTPQNIADNFDQSERYSLLNTTFVYDNTNVVDADHVEGSLAKISIDRYGSLQNGVNGFTKIKADLRHYQKLYRNMTFVARLQYGRFTGQQSPEFILGGVKETLFGGQRVFDFNPINSNIDEGDALYLETNIKNPNILFHEFITDLRGYVYNRMSGTDVMLINTEVRLPITKFITNEYVKSNFLRNLKFVGFYDIGAAWTGVSPFNSDNSINTRTFEEGNYILTLKNFRFPWLMSYGAGVRTTMFGYYVKFDIGFPIQEIDDTQRTFHLSLGYDF